MLALLLDLTGIAVDQVTQRSKVTGGYQYLPVSVSLMSREGKCINCATYSKRRQELRSH